MENNFHLTAIAFLEKELSELEAKRATLVSEIDIEIGKRQKLLEGHREIIRGSKNVSTSPELPKPSDELVVQAHEPVIPKNAFKNITIIEGIKKYLRMAQTGRSTREIADAFAKGGMKKANDKYLLDTIRTALRRRGERNGIVKVEDRWWLAEWPHTPKAQDTGADDSSSHHEPAPNHGIDSAALTSTTLPVASNSRTGNEAHSISALAFDEEGRPLSKTQRIKNIALSMEEEEISQPLVLVKVRELCPDLVYIDPTIVTKALRELEADGVLVQTQKARAKLPAMFRRV